MSVDVCLSGLQVNEHNARACHMHITANVWHLTPATHTSASTEPLTIQPSIHSRKNIDHISKR